MMNQREVVLIVDDERFNINVLVDRLSSDYDTMVAKNGLQALKRAQGARAPDLILLDIMMPEIDGYEVCRKLKEDDNTRDIPIIFISALTNVGDEEKGLELGAVDYITKPIKIPIVQARVAAHPRGCSHRPQPLFLLSIPICFTLKNGSFPSASRQ